MTAKAEKLGLRQEIDADVKELYKDVHPEAVMEAVEKIEGDKKRESRE